MKGKVGIFTSLMMSPPHPRIMMEKELLEKNGYETEIIFSKTKKSEANLFHKLLYYLSLTYFRWDLISRYRKQILGFNTVIIYDLSLLPLVRFASRNGKKVVYETIDNNVFLVFYELQKRIAALSLLRPVITRTVQWIERRITEKYADRIIVNSEALAKEFLKEKTSINFYSSPFEKIIIEKPLNAGKPALIYLGIFSAEKGANEMLELSKELSLPLYVFGEIRNISAEKIRTANVIHKERMSIGELTGELKAISGNNLLIGVSLIMPVNKSYATQEANKEIDYLALGIPFIGNYRTVTASKISAGCGVFIDDEKNIQKLLNDTAFYNSLSTNALNYYAENYSEKKFEKILSEAITSDSR